MMHEANWTAWIMQTAKKWSDISDVIKYTGIDAIDHDHKTLTEYSLKLNQVLDRAQNDYSLALINETKDLLNDIYLYTKEHFKREEDFISAYSLSGYEVQRSEHERILAMLQGIMEQFNSGKINITKHLKMQILEWLVKHINMVDYNIFQLENWSGNIANATKWDDVKMIIRLTGIEEIDNQHKIMTEKALAAISKIARYPDVFTINKTCDSLISYANFHFEYEYNFMSTYRIKNLMQHQNEHLVFTEKIGLYKSELKKDIDQLKEMKAWVINWWINHINTIDNNDFAFNNWGYQMIDQAERVEDVAKLLKKTGIKDIDDDHLKLMELTLNLNTLINTITDSNDLKKDQFTAIFDSIYNSATFHFAREEEIMVNQGMEILKSHAEEHAVILNKLAEIKDNYLSGRIFLSSNFKNMILEWWINHTNTTDYKTFVEHYSSQKGEAND